MKKVITMVGTSIFEKYFNKKGKNDCIKNYYIYLKNSNKRTDQLESEKRRVDRLRETIKSWALSEPEREDISAEIKSLVKLRQELREELEVYLLCSDTILSKLAGEVIEEISSEKFSNLYTIKKVIVIKGLQVWDSKEFNEGMSNLITEIYSIAGEYWENIVINITGGYKATIPYLTILAQINKCDIYYIFEDTDELIKIPYIPIDIKWGIFEENERFFFDLERSGIKEIDINLELNREVISLLETCDNLYCLNPLGITLWERYKSNFEYFYISSEVKNYLDRHPERRKIVEKSLVELKRRLKLNPQDPDLNHSLKNIVLPKGFSTFKHKEENLQVRILYKYDTYNTKYNLKEINLYIGLIVIGSEVHNVESEYVKLFETKSKLIEDISKYEFYRIKRRCNNV